MKLKKTLILISILCMYPSLSYAYLDPGTGSMIFQSLIATGLFVAATTGIFWNYIKSFFRKLIWWRKNKDIQIEQADENER